MLTKVVVGGLVPSCQKATRSSVLLVVPFIQTIVTRPALVKHERINNVKSNTDEGITSHRTTMHTTNRHHPLGTSTCINMKGLTRIPHGRPYPNPKSDITPIYLSEVSCTHYWEGRRTGWPKVGFDCKLCANMPVMPRQCKEWSKKAAWSRCAVTLSDTDGVTIPSGSGLFLVRMGTLDPAIKWTHLCMYRYRF